MPTRTVYENVIDGILLFLASPILLEIGLSFICSGWDEGSMSGSCLVPLLDPLYNFVSALMLAFAFGLIFGGALVLGPVLVVLSILSLVRKIKRYSQGGYPRTTGGVLIDLITWMPIAAVLYFVSLFLPH